MFITCPDDCVRIMVDNHSDVFVALAVTGLIDPDLFETIKPGLWIRLYILPGSCDTSADCLPINTEILGNSRAADVLGHPCGCKIE